MTHGKTYIRRINHKATKSKTNTGTTALERSVEQTTGGFKALLQLANFTLGPDAINTEIHKNSVFIKAPNSVNASKRKHKDQINHYTWICLFQLCKVCFGSGAEEIITMIQRPKWRCSSMLWSMESMSRHKRSHGHPLHPGLAPDVLTLSCLWIQLGQDERVRLTLRASPSLQSNSQRMSS